MAARIEAEGDKAQCKCGGPIILSIDHDSTLQWFHEMSEDRECWDGETATPCRDVPGPSRADDAAARVDEMRERLEELQARHGLVGGWSRDGFMDPPADKVHRARALGDRLRASSEHRVQECGAFIGEALDGTLEEAKLVAFLRGRP